MGSLCWIGPRPATESFEFDPLGDVLLKLTRRFEKDDFVESDSETSSIADEEEEDPDTFPGSDNVSAHDEDPTIDVDRLTISDGGEPEILHLKQPVHMRVSSRHLMLASPVFAVMLDRYKFKEGTTLHAEGSVDIELPDDDPDAWEVLLNVIHGRTRKVPRKVGLLLLTQIAILVNKYEMLDVVEIFSDTWIRRCLKKGLPEQYERCEDVVMSWLFIAWVFEKPKIFKPITRTMIHCAPNVFHHDLDLDPPIPNTLLDVLQERRLEAIDSLLTIITTLTTTYTLPTPQCNPSAPDTLSDPVELSFSYACDSMLLGSLIKSSAKLGIFPIPDRPFAGIAFDRLAEGIRDMDLKSKCDGNLKGYVVRHACHGVRARMVDEVRFLETGICGLDLRDFKKLGSG
ncbi:uncharacterized protein LY89DRAFT_670340 [Mollisia scopiformis]|uniref:BTB domain-containing protein n=1 Tax=Mollisia scopiformis TaxID=149040 RepID=A0A194X6K3_MOLSC|nr:uncharacterized protein LY89DRAFT_670340 [Mollisia scopiformis]KUJ15798.1 hypothetical protein LY89DRAFT_670340 [Mollisia scopiformis]